MNKHLIRYALPIGLLLFVGYKITNCFVVLSDAIVYPLFITSTVFMLTCGTIKLAGFCNKKFAKLRPSQTFWLAFGVEK